MQPGERFSYPRPPVRPLKIYAFDPMVGRDTRTRISVDTRNEPLGPGPLGARIAVVDYDARHQCFYTPVNLDDPAILMQGGMDHSEGDPRFHQQMAYAVATRILEIFDRALGRPIDLGGFARGGRARPLRLFPHAFELENAFYDPDMGAILFGYFRADAADTGGNIPGQLIFSCLSYDIIAHELTHALIDRLSPKGLRGEHPDTVVGSGSDFDLVTKLEKAVNGTSLMLMFVVGRAHLLFPGDAQWGTWSAALADPEWNELLSKTTFYKVGHHASHNATPRAFVEKHLSRKFSAMVSTRKVKKWPDIPRGPLLEALRARSNRVIRSASQDVPDSSGFRREANYVEARFRL